MAKKRDTRSEMVELNEIMVSMGEQLDKLAPKIAVIAKTGNISAEGGDIRLLLSCARYVCLRQEFNALLEKSVAK